MEGTGTKMTRMKDSEAKHLEFIRANEMMLYPNPSQITGTLGQFPKSTGTKVASMTCFQQ